eukprot:TRINITY_DN1617_c0_g1_i11.p1 TRINITY_DN1617_c0_g1~~TRINITY_DN1617_c0_g1_i11.p1  ORF type:complete len:182 (+),score=21.06 TRINITY_DN1617_c0_g1_i11:45-590(+)
MKPSAMDIEKEKILLAAKKWAVIYPNYLSSNCTVEQGRRIAKSKAVDQPTLQEISEVLQYLKLHHVLEVDKAYPRDWLIPGRVRVQIRNDAREPINPLVKNSNGVSFLLSYTCSICTFYLFVLERQLLLKLGELIPKLKSRANRQASQAQTTTASTGANKNKKKKKQIMQIMHPQLWIRYA